MNKGIISLVLSAIAMLLSVLWMFFGEAAMMLFMGGDGYKNFYVFISGVIFSFGVIAVVTFFRSVLYLSEFLTQSDNLSLQLVNEAFDKKQDGICFKDRKGNYKIINAVARQILDQQVINADSKYSEADDLFLPDKLDKVDRMILYDGETFAWKSELETISGTRHYDCIKFPVKNSKGHVIGIAGVFRNISELEKLEKTSAQIENRFNDLFNKLPIPSVFVDPATLLPFRFNGAILEMLDYSRQEFSELRLSAHVDSNDIESFHFMVSELLNKGGGSFEMGLKKKSKDMVNVSGFAQEILINDKKYMHILLQDITESRRSINELISSEQKFRSLFEFANDAILIVAVKTLQIIDINEICLKMFAYSREEMTLMNLFDVYESANQREANSMLEELENYRHVSYENKIKNSHGEILEVEVNAHKVNYGRQEVYQFVIRDIGERKQTELALRESEQRYRMMFETNQAIKLVVNPDELKIEYANPSAAKFYGYNVEQMQGMALDNIYALADHKLRKLIKESQQNNVGFYVCPHRLANGDIRLVEIRDGLMEVAGKNLLYSVVHDVTTIKQAEDQLVLAETIYDCSHDAVVVTDKAAKVISCNQAFTNITGYLKNDVVAKDANLLIVGRGNKLITDEVIEDIEKNHIAKDEVWLRFKNGETHPVSVTINKLSSDNGISYVIQMAPKLQAQDERMSNYSHYVGLTGLPNKLLFMDRLYVALERSQRKDNRLVIMLIDFDNFSSVNHIYGYEAGDGVMQAIAKRLGFNVRESDTVAHFSSDDFAILFEELSDVQHAAIVAQKIISTLTEPFQIDAGSISIDVSIGISVSSSDGSSADELLRSAEYALNLAQKHQGSYFEIATKDGMDDADFQLKLDENLHHAVKNDELEIKFLAQVDIKSSVKLESLEVLVRWNRPGHGLIMPSRFVPQAEQSGFIDALGYKVIDMACEQISIWQSKNLFSGKIHFNLSQMQLNKEFFEYLTNKCQSLDISPSAIAFDIKEEYLITSTRAHKNILRELHKYGFSICVDDFGRDAASLNCMLQTPVDIVKVDQSLMLRSLAGQEARLMLQGLLAMAEKLNIQVVAEGVETESLYNHLKQLGFEHMQGYYFSEPVESKDIPSLINQFGG